MVAGTPRQAYRDFAVSSPLGEDALVFRRMTAMEALSRPFLFTVDVLTQRSKVDFDAMLGKDMTVRVTMEKATRHFNGFVARFAHVGSEGRFGLYRAELRPWFWFLTRNRDCRIFQDKTVPEIVKEVLAENGFTDIRDRLSGEYKAWEYCVQYQESDFNFISRLLEHEGIYYYFTHKNGSHEMVMADGIGSHDYLEPERELRFSALTTGENDAYRTVTDWTVSREVTTGVYTVEDFDFERPRSQLRASLPRPRPHAMAGMEWYEYPADMALMRTGDRAGAAPTYARDRLEALQVGHETIEAATIARELECGRLFALARHPHAEQNREYLVLSTETTVVSDQFEAGAMDGDNEAYRCRFSVLPAKEQYRPLRITPMPRIQGPQTAMVTGKAGEEIWTDKYGRIKVRFHWDRSGRNDETSSCWIRVAQNWAGKKWGFQFIPRVGHEVVVEFLEGDPNRPLVTGSVYNGEAFPPFPLPENAPHSGIRTNSTKGGGGANEIRFEDKKGEERLFIHAERNKHVRVKRSSLEWIGHNRHLLVKTNQLERVEGDKHQTVYGDRNEQIGGSLSLKIKGESHEVVEASAALEVGTDLHVKANQNIVLESNISITLKVGASFIKLSPAMIYISGPLVYINSGGSAGSGAGAHPDAPAQPKEAMTTEPGQVSTVEAKSKYTPPKMTVSSHPVADQLRKAFENGTPFCEKCEAARRANEEEKGKA